MKFYKIATVGKIISGSTPDTTNNSFWEGNIPWVTPKEINKLSTPFLQDTERKITIEGLKSCSAVMLPKGSILFTSRAPIGLVAIADIDVATNQGFKSIKLNKGFYPLYIYYVLKFFSARIQYLGTGTTFKEISKSTFEEFEIPVPDNIVDQIKIGELLHKIDLLIQKRKESDQLLWEFMQSSFQHFFKNIKGPILPLSNFCKINPLKSEIKDISNDTVVSFLPMANVSSTGQIDLSLTRKLNEVRSSFTYFKDGDVLFAKITPSMENGKGAIANNLINRIGFGTTEFHVLRPLSNISNSAWLYFVTSQEIFREMAEQNMTGSAGQKRVNADFFSLYKIAVPPIKLQDKFAEVVEYYSGLKIKNQKSLAELEDLFSSISQNALAGNLDISKMQISNLKLLLADLEQPDIEVINDSLEILQDGANLKALPKAEKNYKVNTVNTSKISYDEISTETIANWIKDEYAGFYFNSEMVQRFLLEEHLTFINYFSSEDLKKNPPLNSKDDFRKFFVDALSGRSPFLKIRQHFHDGINQEEKFRLVPRDKKLVEEASAGDSSGIYFTIEE